MKQSYFKIEFSMSLFSELFSNEGKVSGEGVSLRAHFNPSPVF